MSEKIKIDDDFLEASVKRTKRNWTAIYITIIAAMIIILVILCAVVWNMMNVFSECNWIIKNVDKVLIN